MYEMDIKERIGILGEQWPKINALILRSSEDPAFRDRLHYGTPNQKLTALSEVGLSFEELVFIHHELETIVFQGSLRFWWW